MEMPDIPELQTIQAVLRLPSVINRSDVGLGVLVIANG